MDENRPTTIVPALPRHARLAINHCNLPADILGSLNFQRHPVALHLDGVEELHAAFFNALRRLDDASERAMHFKAYMSSSFLLEHLDEAGFDPSKRRSRRNKADYIRMLRGWLFDADGREAAVLKGWVESRFGLRPRNHRGPLGDFVNERYQIYLTDRARGLYNTNALEAQLDLLYTFCQYETRQRYRNQSHLQLFRGINRIDEHEVLAHPDKHRYVLLLNNLNSFTSDRERADEFGDYILEASVPREKLLFIPGLLPDGLKGEDEYLVIGGIYQIGLNLF